MDAHDWRLGLVDDDALTLAALSSLVRSRFADGGMSVAWSVRSGDEAVDLCLDRSTRPDAVLVDMGMDDVDGAMTMRRIRRLSTRIMLLAMTSHSLTRYRELARSSGAAVLLDKADFSGLACCLRDCAAGRKPRNGFGTVTQGSLSTGEQASPLSGSRTVRSLSAREMEVMDWTIEGLTAKEVAAKMAISEPTVKTHIRHVIIKLRVRNKLQAIRLWSEMRRDG
ncbi:response regulator transcription factor [Bifidobacterium callitrichos]|uniref:LuxR family transcriptional regulator n=1 Tax=Bifidobacterium callitrichos DSM 23973 TaxID=1437609 RepID=A0A086ZZB7_9BIFI|nr:response regulator transcription factor [Bifidobacterium callitrichos]KFI51867.1 LuxR family transcriptional regulator [Bifidobacterium callitrichos DSM 23973]